MPNPKLALPPSVPRFLTLNPPDAAAVEAAGAAAADGAAGCVGFSQARRIVRLMMPNRVDFIYELLRLRSCPVAIRKSPPGLEYWASMAFHFESPDRDG
jgi:hypothetical protein